jgi:hypothetical protein
VKLESRAILFRKMILLIVFLFLTGDEVLSQEVKGVVVYKSKNCSYFIVESPSGYALLEWYGGNEPEIGDVIIGDFESYGFKKIYNLTAGKSLIVWVEDFWLSKRRVIEKYLEKCF